MARKWELLSDIQSEAAFGCIKAMKRNDDGPSLHFRQREPDVPILGPDDLVDVPNN